MNPDKGNGVVIMDIKDYNESINHLLSDRTKFKIIKEDTTNSRMTTLQNYIRKLKKQGHINDDEYKILYPKNAKIGRAHGSAKIHKDFERIPPLRPILPPLRPIIPPLRPIIPPLRPIIYTIGSMNYGVGKFISNMLNPLTLNNYYLNGSFD